jgi:hypothetical protein
MDNNALSHCVTKQGKSDEVKCEKREDREQAEGHNPQNTQTCSGLKETVAHRNLPVRDSLLFFSCGVRGKKSCMSVWAVGLWLNNNLNKPTTLSSPRVSSSVAVDA